MKKLMLYVPIVILMVTTNAASAQAQASEEIWNMVINNFGSALKADPAELAKFKAGLTSRKTSEVIAVLGKYAVGDSGVKVSEIKFLHPTNDDGTTFEFTPVKKNQNLDLISLRLDSLNPNDPSMRNKTFPFMVYDFAKGNHPYFVWTIKFPGEEEMVAQMKAMRTGASGNGNIATTNTGNVPQGGSGYQVISGVGQQGGATYVDPRYVLVDVGGGQKKLLLMQPDGTLADADNTAKQNQAAQVESSTLPQSGSGWQMINYRGEDRMIVYTPNGPYMLPKEQEPKEDRVEIINPGRHGVIVNHGADGQAAIMTPSNEKLTAMEIRRLYDLQEHTPTSGSADAVAARNGLVYGAGGGAAYYQSSGLVYSSGVQIGVGGGNCGGCYSGNQTHVVPSAGAIAGNGPVGWNQYQQNQYHYGGR